MESTSSEVRPLFRQPYMVEAHTHSPNGMSDPCFEYFKTEEDARARPEYLAYEGAYPTVYEKDADGEWGEV